MDGLQHILKGIGRVGVVDDGGKALRRADGVEAPVDALQRTHRDENVLGLLAQHHGGTVDAEQVRDVEAPDELHAHLAAVNLEVHALEVALDDTGTEVGHLADAVGLHLRLRVLHHEQAVLVVGIGNGEGALRQLVEEHLLGVAVVLYGLVVVQMVAGQVGKESAGELQTADALLGNGVA